jgi:hypothetical protein
MVPISRIGSSLSGAESGMLRRSTSKLFLDSSISIGYSSRPMPAPIDPKRAAAASRASKRRRGQRDRLWSDAEGIVFQSKRGGWAQMPRTVPLVASLIDQLRAKENAGRLYLTLWSHEYGDGFVEVPDPALIAMEAGYVTNRAERTFAERMRVLSELGFVRTAPLGVRDFGYVLLVDPHQVVCDMRARSPESVPPAWWTAFGARCSTAGIELPEPAISPIGEPGKEEISPPT